MLKRECKGMIVHRVCLAPHDLLDMLTVGSIYWSIDRVKLTTFEKGFKVGWNYINDQQVLSDIRFAHNIFMFDIKRGNLVGFTQIIQLLWRVWAALTSPIIKIIVCCLLDLPIVSKNNKQIHSAKNTIVRKKWIVIIIEIFCNPRKIGHDM